MVFKKKKRVGDRGRTVWELGFEKVVVSPRYFRDGLGQLFPLLFVEVDQRPPVLPADDHDLERPHSPVRHAGPERVVFKDGAVLFLGLALGVVDEQVRSVLLATVLAELLELGGEFFGKRRRCPYLAVGVRVGAAHGGALVLENLHVAVLRVRFFDVRL